MGFKRLLWRATPFGARIDTLKNIINERSIIKGVQRTYREHIYEDNPVTVSIYRNGKLEGKKEGYSEAWKDCSKKLFEMTEEFLRQKTIAQSQFERYENLLNKYEELIGELNEKSERTCEENECLKRLLLKQHELKGMKVE